MSYSLCLKSVFQTPAFTQAILCLSTLTLPLASLGKSIKKAPKTGGKGKVYFSQPTSGAFKP